MNDMSVIPILVLSALSDNGGLGCLATTADRGREGGLWCFRGEITAQWRGTTYNTLIIPALSAKSRPVTVYCGTVALSR